MKTTPDITAVVPVAVPTIVVASGSAIPAAIQQALPQWFRDRPATTEALWAGGVSAWYAVLTIAGVIVGAAVQDGRATSFWDLISYTQTHWWGAVLGLAFPAIRARQAFTKQTEKKVTSP